MRCKKIKKKEVKKIEYSNKLLKKMNDQKITNKLYSRWFFGMFKEFKDSKFEKRGNRISSCCYYWEWDLYRKNKTMILKTVTKCNIPRWCPFCRMWELLKAIHAFREPFNQLVKEGYHPYLLTLTVPNCRGEDLRDTLDKLNSAFKKLFNAFNYPLDGATNKGFKERLISFDAALKVLEITYNALEKTFHPHFHCIVFSKEYPEELMRKYIKGEYSNKRKEYNMLSELDVHIRQIWTMIWDGQRLSKKNLENMSDWHEDLYICDIREMDEKGLYEVLKYTFKDTDVANYGVFKTLVQALEGKRIRQGYGLLYNLKCENVEVGETQSLEQYLEIDPYENSQVLITKGIKTLYTDYQEYRKVSLSSVGKDIKDIEKYI